MSIRLISSGLQLKNKLVSPQVAVSVISFLLREGWERNVSVTTYFGKLCQD